MRDALTTLPEIWVQPGWLHLVCDLALLGGSLVIACVVIQIVLEHCTERPPLLFWGLCTLAVGCGVLQVAGIIPGWLSASRLYAVAKVGATVLLWADCLVLFRLFPSITQRTLDFDVTRQLRAETAKRVRTEEELRQSENRFRTIFDNTRDVILCTDATGRVLDVNKRVAEVFGYEPDELLGKHFTKLGILRFTDIPQIVRLFRNTLLAGKPVELVELDLKHRNGGNVTVEVGTRFVWRDGRVLEVICVFRDVTERRRVEAGVTAAREAVETAQRELAPIC